MKKIVIITISSLLALILLLGLSGVAYLQINYSRIGDVELDITNNQTNNLELNNTYSMSTYNIGFGAYDREFSFFMDNGVTLNGEVLQGEYGRAVSKENALKNTNGSIEILEYLNSDFMLLQEVDTNSTRSYNINQSEMIEEAFYNHASTFSSNFHSGYLPYPLHDMHGIVNSGIQTLSRYQIQDSNRIELPVTTAFFAKFFDLDRCLNITRYTINGSDKEFVLINCHLSAYDEGGVYRKLQVELLTQLLTEEYQKGNYVIAGGDFNHEIANSNFATIKETPIWIQELTNNELPDGFRIESSNESPSCRDSDSPYVANESYVAVVDGFLVSENIEVSYLKNIVSMNTQDITFLYSDHNAVKIEFSFK
ncbi:MAG: endonuclease/exonuclease/phosphatase family protein [bacterium]